MQQPKERSEFTMSSASVLNNQVGRNESQSVNDSNMNTGYNQRYTPEDRRMGKPMPLSAVIETAGPVNSRDDWELPDQEHSLGKCWLYKLYNYN